MSKTISANITAFVTTFVAALFTVNTCVADTDNLRSAYLGPHWAAELSVEQVNDALKSHFDEVLSILETQTEKSVRTAVQRAVDARSNPQELPSPAWLSEVEKKIREHRQLQIERLHEYRDRGQFPRNEGESQTSVPIFVDSHGTHCAVGYLMHRSGADEAVAEVVAENNLVYVPDVEQGMLVDWVLQSGLTQEEAALIQPAYGGPTLCSTVGEVEPPPMGRMEVTGGGNNATFGGSSYLVSNEAIAEDNILQGARTFDLTISTGSELLLVDVEFVTSYGMNVPGGWYNETMHGTDTSPPPPGFVDFLPRLAADTFFTTPGETVAGGFDCHARTDSTDEGPQTNFHFGRITLLPDANGMATARVQGTVQTDASPTPIFDTFEYALSLTAVPEPATGGILAFGMVGIVLMRRRQRFTG